MVLKVIGFDPYDSNPLLRALRDEVLQFTVSNLFPLNFVKCTILIGIAKDNDVKIIQADLAAEETQIQAKENQIREAHSRIQVQQ
jgi:hypothetical protein